MTKHCGDLVEFACKLVQRRFDECPFNEASITEGRRCMSSILGVDHVKGVFDAESGQPFLLNQASHLSQSLGDPDWRILTTSTNSYSSGVPVGFKERLPRTPAVFERKTRWKKYEDDDYLLEERGNYPSASVAMKSIRDQFMEEKKEGRMLHVKLKEAKATGPSRRQTLLLGCFMMAPMVPA